jgi:hypothetical protein
MLADLDLPLTIVFYVADNLPPAGQATPRRSLSDSEVVTLLVAQSIMGITSDRRIVKIARKQRVHLFPWASGTSWCCWTPRQSSARSRETVKRAGAIRLDDPIANAASYGCCRSHSRL